MKIEPKPKRSEFINWTRLRALCVKETKQIFRDPSSNLIAFVLPIIMLFIFGYGISLDSGSIKIALVMEDHSREAEDFAASLRGSSFLQVIQVPSRSQANYLLMNANVRGLVIVPENFSQLLARPQKSAPIQVAADGSEPEIAAFVASYTQGAWLGWQSKRNTDLGISQTSGMGQIGVEPQFWFNPDAISRNYLIPGSITIIMTVVGALLTSLVVAREWERGTMEALLATPITRAELLLSKLIPYFGLGLISMAICVLVAVFVMQVPYHGGVLSLALVSSLFLLSALGLGLFLSTAIRVQFNAAQAALNLAFLPSLMFSGFIYEINSMPAFVRGVTYLFPGRYFVTCMQTLFQAGDLWPILLRNSVELAIFGAILIAITARITKTRLD